MASTARRYPASLSHNAAGPSRPQRPMSVPTSSIDDEVPPPPELPPLPPNSHPSVTTPAPPALPELSSLEFLLRQAGYKETRVFTPEAERVKPRLKRNFDDEGASELTSLYAAMGLDANAPRQVGHMTQPAVPFRSSSSVLRNVALQDATAMLNALRQHRQQQSLEQEFAAATVASGLQEGGDVFWGEQVVNRAAAQVGQAVAAMSPPAKDTSLDVGLRLAKGGNGVRKAKSNYELTRRHAASPPQQEDIAPQRQPELYDNVPEPKTQPTTIRTSFQNAFEREVPPSIASMFSPPQGVATEHMQFDDDAFGYSGYNPLDYEAQEDDDAIYGEAFTYDEDEDSAASGSTPGTSPPHMRRRADSPPLLDERNVFADLGFGDKDGDELASEAEIAAAEQHAQEIGQRILASTVEYDGFSDDEDESVPLPAITIKSPSPPRKTKRVLSRADSLAQAMNDELPIPMALPCTKPRVPAPAPAPAVAKIRPAKSAPALRPSKSTRAPLRISPALPAPPALQTVSPVLCDSVGNDAEDLPPIPSPVAEEPPAATSFSSLALRARKSLTALRASFWATEEPPAQPPQSFDTPTSANPILTPRMDWAFQGNAFAGWNAQDEKSNQSFRPKPTRSATAPPPRPATSPDDPFSDPPSNMNMDIDYTKSFFYKPTTPPRADGTPSSPQRARKRSSVKSLKAALLLPVAAPPVPPIPVQYRRASNTSAASASGELTPQHSPRPAPPQLCILSPGAWEEGRPARPLILEGEEWEGHEVVESWGVGTGVKRGGGKGRKRKGKGKGKGRGRGRMGEGREGGSDGEGEGSPLRCYRR